MNRSDERRGRPAGARNKGETITKAVLRAYADGEQRRAHEVAADIGRDARQVRNAAFWAFRFNLMTKTTIDGAAYYRITDEGRVVIGLPPTGLNSVLDEEGEIDLVKSALMTRPALATVWGMA